VSAAGFYEDGGEGFYGDDSAVELHLAGAFEDAADLLGEIYSVRGDKANGRKWLKKAGQG